MGRSLIVAETEINESKFIVATTHLESLTQYDQIRK